MFYGHSYIVVNEYLYEISILLIKCFILCYRVNKTENGDELMLSCGNEYSEPINSYVLPDSCIGKLCPAR